MRVKREYLTDKAPKPRIIERVVEKIVPKTVEKLVVDPAISRHLAKIESLLRDILSQEGDEGQIIARLDSLTAKIEQVSKAPAAPPAPQPKQPYQFDVVRNAAGDIERIVARPLAGGFIIYGGVK